MATQPRLDSGNGAVRFVERWKRGIAATILVALALLIPSGLACAALYTAAHFLGASELTQSVVGLLGAVIAGPWTLGDRRTLQTIGRLAKIGDD